MNLADFDGQFLQSVPAVIGVDEAGRGPLAGPVCAAAIYAGRSFYESKWVARFGPEINDSKQLKEATRTRIFEALMEADPDLVYWACHLVEVDDIESLNILGATRKAMALCIEDLAKAADCPFSQASHEAELPLLSSARQASLFKDSKGNDVARILVDGKPLKPFPLPHTAIVKGDGKSLAIALASILAKVTRDRYMLEQAKLYPEYGFISNKGYGTPKHIAALKERGPCKLHRLSFLSQILRSS